MISVKRRFFWFGGAAVALILIAVLATGGWSREFALAELRLSNLTCGSCVANVQQALAGVKGVGQIEVSVTSGRARVEFEPAAVAAETIAGRITAAGYPARVTEVLSAAEVKALHEDAARLADRYVARIGDRLVSRTEFAAEVGRLRSGVPEGEIAEPRLQQIAWQEKLRRELMLADAEARRVVVQDGEVTLEVDRMRGGIPEFAKVAERFGGEEAFARLVKEQMIIQRHLEDNVLGSEAEPARKQALFEQWYRSLTDTYPVTIIDPSLKAAVEKAGGCGGKCCG